MAGWPSKTDAEHVPRLALVPVDGGVDAHQAGDVRVGVGARDLEAHATVVGHREQVVDRVQLAPGVVGVVDAAARRSRTRSAASSSSRSICATKGRSSRRTWKVISPRWTTTDSIARSRSVWRSRASRASATSSNHPPYGRWDGAGEHDRGDQAAVAGGVTGAGDAEHAAALARRADLGALAAGRRQVLRRLLDGRLVDVRRLRLVGGVVLRVAHRSRPRIWHVGSALSAVVSAPRSPRGGWRRAWWPGPGRGA